MLLTHVAMVSGGIGTDGRTTPLHGECRARLLHVVHDAVLRGCSAGLRCRAGPSPVPGAASLAGLSIPTDDLLRLSTCCGGDTRGTRLFCVVLVAPCSQVWAGMGRSSAKPALTPVASIS